ncbi:MAG: dockerin type I domain-containing protein [Acutalibacteraceae bacterium]
MKKSLLSLALATALLLTAVFSVVGLQSFAAEDINLLDPSKTALSGGDCTFEYVDGALVITSNGTGGDSIGIASNTTYDPAVYPYTAVTIESEVPFVLAFYDGVVNKWMTSSGDFYPQFAGVGDTPAPAGNYDLLLFTQGCYTWSPDGTLPTPESATMTSIYIEPKAAGKLTIKKLALTEGVAPVASATFTVEEKETAPIKAGDTFTINVSSSALDKVAGVQLKLAYDKTVMQAVSGEAAGYLAQLDQHTVNVAPLTPDSDDPGVGEVWITGMALDNLASTEGEVIATITFEALTDITADQIISAYDALAGYNPEDNQPTVWYDTATVNGGLIIVESPVMLGDVNLDGQVTGKDVVMLRQYLAETITLDDQQLANANVNGDESVTGKDLVMLRQYVAEIIGSLG